jgi:hypothetical protein
VYRATQSVLSLSPLSLSAFLLQYDAAVIIDVDTYARNMFPCKAQEREDMQLVAKLIQLDA